MARLASPRRRSDLLGDRSGTAAVEFALIVGFLSIALLNTVDIARYFYLRSAQDNVTQMASQVVLKTCDPTHVPATTNCTGFTAAVTAALQGGSLGNRVTFAAGSPSEAYYCVDASGVLTQVAAIGSRPADCSAVGSSTTQPGDYVKIQSSLAYAPLFPGISVTSTLASPIVVTTMMRVQ